MSMQGCWGLQWHCQLSLGDKGQWGSRLAGVGTQAHITQVQMQQLLARAQHLYMHMGQSRYRQRDSKPLRSPEILTQGKKGLQLMMHWCFRWVIGKRPVFIQREANYLQILDLIFTHHSLTNCPKYHISKKHLSER